MSILVVHRNIQACLPAISNLVGIHWAGADTGEGQRFYELLRPRIAHCLCLWQHMGQVKNKPKCDNKLITAVIAVLWTERLSLLCGLSIFTCTPFSCPLSDNLSTEDTLFKVIELCINNDYRVDYSINDKSTKDMREAIQTVAGVDMTWWITILDICFPGLFLNPSHSVQYKDQPT